MNGLTVIIFTAVSEPHELVTIYLIVSIPGDTPVTTPPTPIVALLIATLLHVPPPELVKVIIVPTHTDDKPDMIPATGKGLTVIVLLTVSAPQRPLTT